MQPMFSSEICHPPGQQSLCRCALSQPSTVRLSVQYPKSSPSFSRSVIVTGHPKVTGHRTRFGHRFKEAFMRLAGRMRLGFFPLPTAEAKRVQRFLQFPDQNCSALDPCIGEGVAFSQIASGEKVLRYGIELEANRAEAARAVVNALIQGNCFDVQCPVESLSLIYLNPPYDFELSEQRSQRMERLFLEHVYRWLRPGGVLVLVIPARRIGEGGAVLSAQFRDVRVYRLTEPESVRYGQIVLFGVRRTRYERERLPDSEITRARRWCELLVRNADGIQPLPSEPDHQYTVPAGEPVRLVYRGLPLDQIEDLLSRSSAYR